LAIERAGCLVKNGTIPSAALAEAIALGAPEQVHLAARRVSAEDGRVLDACVGAAWDLEAAAKALGMHRATVYRRLRAMGVSARSARTQQVRPRANSHSRRANSRDNRSTPIAK
jgi:transcriptional regulator of acetoin/glycerol metabolism